MARLEDGEGVETPHATSLVSTLPCSLFPVP